MEYKFHIKVSTTIYDDTYNYLPTTLRLKNIHAYRLHIKSICLCFFYSNRLLVRPFCVLILKENKTSLMYQPFLERQVVNFLAQHLLILLQNQVNH